jgi:aminoglycoside 2'-N-acetyltransferase I
MGLREAETGDLSSADLAAIRALMDAAFAGGFSDEDMAHALGGWHVLVEEDGRLVSHAAVVPRELEVAGSRVRAGYVEGVGTDPALQGRGYGTQAMRAAGDHIRGTYGIGALSTGEHAFYERLGWEPWRGATFVRHPDGRLERTPEEDDGIMVLRVDGTVALDLTETIACEWRPGDVW